MTATLIVSLSGLDEVSLADCATFTAELDAREVSTSWLLSPRPAGGRHRPHTPAIRWLRERLGAGDALVVHGYDHTVDPLGCWRPVLPAQVAQVAQVARFGRFGRRAEFAALPEHEAGLRLVAAVRALGELGLHSDVFAPPRWLASAGTLAALRRAGFRVCADAAGVRLLDGPGNTVLPGRVCRTGSVATVARAARRGQLVRLAFRGADLVRPAARRAALDAVDTALRAGARPASYRDPVPRASSAALSA